MRWIPIAWLALLMPATLFIEVLYKDQGLNDYARMNNLVWALPMVYIVTSLFLSSLWSKGIVQKCIAVLLGLLLLVGNSMPAMRYMWHETDDFMAYGELQRLSLLVSEYAKGLPYDLIVYKYNEESYVNQTSYELIYFLDLMGLQKPERYNNTDVWSIRKLKLADGPARMSIYVIDKQYVNEVILPLDAMRLEGSSRYVIYRHIKE
jgi:hypothetical protein